VQQLIEQLGSENFRVREAAGKSLQARGTEILPALRQAQNHPDLEIRRRVADLLPVVEKAAALAPTRLNLDLTDRPIREAVADISRQTGYKIILDRSVTQDDKPRSFHLRRATFWEAMEKVCATGGLRYEYRIEPKNAVFLTSGQASPSILNGPFRVTAHGSQYLRQTKEKYLDVTLVIAPEPKLGLLSVNIPLVSQAETDEKESLLLPSPQEGLYDFPAYGWGNPIYHSPLGAYLKPPSGKARTLKSFKGSTRVLLLARRSPHVTIDNVLEIKDKTFKADQTTWHIEQVVGEARGKSGRYRVKMSLRDEREKGNRDLDFSWAASLPWRIELQDAKGRLYQCVGDSSWQVKTTPASCKGTLTFYAAEGSEIGVPAKLIYYRWMTVCHRVDFEFRDLRLP
jgi:hypothetical protein